MTTRKRLNSAQVLARMKRGEPLLRADYSGAYFPDDARPGVGVLYRLIRDGKVTDAPPNIGAAYLLTLPSIPRHNTA